MSKQRRQQSFQVIPAIIPHRKTVPPNSLATEKAHKQLHRLRLAACLRVVKREPIVIVIAAFAVVVFLQDRKMPLAAGNDRTELLNVFRPELLNQILGGVPKHGLITLLVLLVPIAVFRMRGNSSRYATVSSV